MSTRWLFRGDWLDALLGFAVGHVFSHGRIVPAQLEPVRIVLAILQRGVGVAALGATQLNNDTITLFTCHDAFLIKLVDGVVADLSVADLLQTSGYCISK